MPVTAAPPGELATPPVILAREDMPRRLPENPALEGFPDGKDDRTRFSERDARHKGVFRTRSGGHQGTAVAVGSKLALSVSHVLTGSGLDVEFFDDDARSTSVRQLIGASRVTYSYTAAGGGARELTGIRFEAQRSFPVQFIPQAIAPGELLHKEIEVIGYPLEWRGRKTETVPVVHRGRVMDVLNGRIYYGHPDTSQGQSGGPIVLAGTHTLVGIHGFSFGAAGHPTLRNVNAGIYISTFQVDEIEEWKR